MKLRDELIKLDACKEAVEWVGKRTLTRAWAKCERGDWMLWYAAKKDIDRKLLVKCACLIVQRVLHLIPDGENRPRRAIETAEAWIYGKATLDGVKKTAYAAYVAAYASDVAAYASDVAAYASDAAARAAAYAAADAAHAAADAAHAADAADAAARAAAYAAADAAERKAQADIVREIITVGLLEAGAAGKEGR